MVERFWEGWNGHAGQGGQASSVVDECLGHGLGCGLHGVESLGIALGCVVHGEADHAGLTDGFRRGIGASLGVSQVAGHPPGYRG